MLKQIVVCAAFAVMTTGPVRAQATPPDSPEAKRIESLVNKAADLIEKQGTERVFPEMRKKGSEWYSGEVYVFAYDPDLTVILQPAFPQREGQHMAGEKDKNGKPFHDEFMKVVQTKGSGWVDYWVPKPGETQPSQKWSYVKAVKMNGRTGVVGAGFYPK